MELSPRYDPTTTETKWLREWAARGYGHADENSPARPYTIVIPPPNITGILHMGHALNNTLQDILIRWKRMAGFNALWLPGTDHASIATQYVVERALLKEGLTRHQLGREKFLERVWQWKEHHGRTIIEQLKLMGCSCDWQRERFTMDAGLSRAVRTVFKRLYDDGLIYKGNYLVNWCPRCQTTLADDEVEYTDRAGKLWHLRYPVEGMPERFAVVATTRPETMLGDTAVAVNPADERYREWIGHHVVLPLTGRRIPIIADDFVDKHFGTGMVKITPAHDPNDYQAGKRHGLEEINILTPDGRLNDNAPAPYRGLDRYEARKRVVADLEAQGLIEKIEDYAQRVGTCYRCATVIEPYISLQWFVKMRPLAEPARKAVEDGRVRFTPKAREKEYYHWLDNVRDWPISRQLWWGHRIPAWYGPDGEIFVSADEHLPDEPRFRTGAWVQDEDVLDTWFSSALWPFSTLGWPDETKDLKVFYPTDTLVTGKEILFFWVARMIMMGLYFMREVPFRDVYFNPVVADEHGKKMSKSKGNALDPRDLMAEYGTDALRYTLCEDATREQYIAFSVKQCETNRNFMNKLWNAARLVLANVEDLTPQALAAAAPENPRDRACLALEDRWILSRYAEAVSKVNAALEAFEFDLVAHSIYDFLWRDLCDYYLELVKPRLYTRDNEVSRRDCQGLLVVVLEGTLRLLHPVCPFITEELWSTMRAKWSGDATGSGTLGAATLASFAAPNLMVAPWPAQLPASLRDADAERDMQTLQQVIHAVRNVRGELKVPPATPANVVVDTPDEAVAGLLRAHEGFFRTLSRVSGFRVGSGVEPASFSASANLDGMTVYVELPPELRLAEIERLHKEQERISAERDRQKTKLANEAFVSKAPPAVIQKEREKLARLEEELASLAARLGRMGG